MKELKQIIFTNYKGYTSDLKRTLSVRFGLTLKNDQIHKYLNGDIIIKAPMTEAQEQRIKVWRDEMSELSE